MESQQTAAGVGVAPEVKERLEAYMAEVASGLGRWSSGVRRVVRAGVDRGGGAQVA